MTRPAPHLLLPFLDDSTLFFARAMRDLLVPLGARVTLGWMADEGDLSERQLQQVLPEGPDGLVARGFFDDSRNLAPFDAIVTCRIMRPLTLLMRRRSFLMQARRPAVVAFTGGFDFYPEQGFENRLTCDALFLLPSDMQAAYRRHAARQTAEPVPPWQQVDFGHPFLIHPAPDLPARIAAEGRRDVYFYAQAISPRSRASRMHMLQVLAAIARAHPDRRVWIKLRHLPGENAGHLHKEEFDYPSLLPDLPGGVPANLDVTAISMAESLQRAGVGITCTSTAAADLIAAGVPTLVHLDYVENYLDPLNAPMRAMFEGSGVVAGLDDLLALRAGTPDPAWMARFFCPPDLGERVLRRVAAFQAMERPGTGPLLG